MFFFIYNAAATPDHPDHAVIDEAWVLCWIQRDTEEEARELAEEVIKEDHWEILGLEESGETRRGDYEDDDENLEYFQRAVEEGEVFVFNVCPRFPVYFFHAMIKPSDGAKPDIDAREAGVWMIGECVSEIGEEDILAEDFWSGANLEEAQSVATKAINDQGFDVVEIANQRACCRRELDEDERQFFDDAEENGLCVVFWQDNEE